MDALMEPRESGNSFNKVTNITNKQLPKIKSLLKKYRHVKTMQSSLLQLSELASKITDMQKFYPALESVINSLFIADSFFIVLAQQSDSSASEKLALAYNHNLQERDIFNRLTHQDWLESLTGFVYSQQKPMHCNAAKRHDLAQSSDITLHGSVCEDWLGVPLKRGKQIIGVLALQSYQKQIFTQNHSDLLEFVAIHLVTAIDRVQSRESLENSIQNRTEKLQEANKKLQQEIFERQKAEKLQSTLLTISEITASSSNLTSFYQKLHQELKQLINANSFYVALLTENNNDIEFPFYVDEDTTISQFFSQNKGLVQLVLDIEKPVLVKDNSVTVLTNDDKLYSQPLNSSYLINNVIMPKTYIGVPLHIDGKISGVLAVQDYNHGDAYQYSELKLLRFISQHIASAIERKAEQVRRESDNVELEALITERTKALQASNLNLRMQIEERRKAEARLYHDAHHDALTKLPNRAMLIDRVTYALRHLKRHPNHKSAVLFIDLDRFKVINDTLGHHIGDVFLIEISHRLKKCIRDNDILARLGGDEFVILLDSLQDQDDIEEVATRITIEVEKPFNLDGHTVYSSASIGISHCHNQYKNADEILRDADAAMYQAKSLGRGRYVFFDRSMREQLLASMTLEQELRVAIKQQQFELHYQSILDLSKTSTIGFEALLRWNHPKNGLLTPSQFLTLAEETGMILEIENWVIKQVCLQLEIWKDDKQYNNTFISVNLSGRHLNQIHQLNDVMGLIENNTKQPERLIIEFDERAFCQQPEQSLKSLKKLKTCGVKLALDDYGAGMSSMNFLHDYPFEFIKLDRSFIRSLNSSDKNIALIKALSALGEKFGYRLVAEGIESKEMLAKVQAAGCEFGQGYFINHPTKINNTLIGNTITNCA